MEHVFGIKVKLNLSPHKDIKSFHFQHLCFVFEEYPSIHCFPLILVRVYDNLPAENPHKHGERNRTQDLLAAPLEKYIL